MISTYFIPVHTVSESNSHEHWRARQKRAKSQRGIAMYVVRCAKKIHTFPVTVKLIRCSPRLLDDDNLRGALKAVRDGVADALGCDDRDGRIRWEYDQAKAHRLNAGVMVEITGDKRS